MKMHRELIRLTEAQIETWIKRRETASEPSKRAIDHILQNLDDDLRRLRADLHIIESGDNLLTVVRAKA